MAVKLFETKGTPIEKQIYNWRDLVRVPISKLDDDAFTRVRIILMNGIEEEANRFQHFYSRVNKDLREPLARIRRSEQHQQTLVNWLLPPDQSPLETTIAFEQVAIEVTAAVAKSEPDPYMAAVYRFGMLEDFDHLYRYSALMDRLEGKDANNILQCYTDVCPGRATSVEHRDPADDIRNHYDHNKAEFITKLNALTILSGEQQTRNFYMNIGPMYPDPVGRQLYAEIASIEEQHVTQYESIIDPNETLLEKWLMHEANEVYNYYSCLEYETNPQVKSIWERFLDYELGHFHYVAELFKKYENRDPAEIIPQALPNPISYISHRAFVQNVLKTETHLRARGTEFVSKEKEPDRSVQYRNQINAEGSPSELVAAGYRWQAGTELSEVPVIKKAA